MTLSLRYEPIRHRCLLLLLLAACALPTSSELAAEKLTASDNLVVATRTGQVRGMLTGQTREFLGIPYAQPPLDQLRFAAPRPLDAWPDVRDATHFGKSCMQTAGGTVSELDMSEDCLTLNVFAPANARELGRPVIMFIHGGAFVAGGSSTYDAKSLREAGDVVIVTINYRLGSFGFFAHPSLCSQAEPCTNQGLRDQQLALTWVQDNIRVFGGDPENVTIFGESAGSVSACAHMFANGSQGKAQHFILQSGICTKGPLALQSEQRARDAGQALIHAACPDAPDPIACLRGLPARNLAAVLIDTVDPVVDGYWPWLDHVLFDAPLDALLERGAGARGSVIVGTNQHEWLLWQTLGVTSAPLGNLGLRSAIDRYFPSIAEAVAQHYVPADPLQAADAFIKLMTDAYFRCPARALIRALPQRAYLYELRVPPAAHALDVDYVFDLPAISLLYPFQAPDPLLPNVVHAMQSYWTQLAAAGDPNRPELPAWPAYGTAREHMVFQEPLAHGQDLSTVDCDLWDSLWHE